MSKQIRFEIMCVLQGDDRFVDGVANDFADKLSDFMEDELGIDCAIVVMDAETEEEIEP
jgi:hypothetical protein